MLETLIVGFLGGLASGVSVYLVRQKLRADSLRSAIAMEIRKSTPVGTVQAAIMGTDSLETPIIDANLDKVHLLTNDEVAMIARYQNQMAKVRWYNEQNSPEDRVSISRGLAEDTSEVAETTSNTLEGNVWDRPRPLPWVRGWIKSD